MCLNNDLLVDILEEVVKNGAKCCDPVIVNCCKECDDDGEGPGGEPEPEPEEDNCTSETNAF